MPMWFPDEPDPTRWEDKPTEEDLCTLGISRHCTEVGAYLWEGQPVCYFCLNLAEQAKERAEARERLLNEQENLEARR